jgi:hypothetical protein
MPISSGIISKNIYAQFFRSRITGRNNIDLANAVGMATYMFLSTPNMVTCSLAGTAGPVSTLTSLPPAGLVPAAISKAMLSQAGLRRLTGRSISTIFDAAALGLTISLTGMSLTGNAVGIAVGAGTGIFSAASTQAMANILLSQAVTKYLKGRNNIDLANCIAFGLVTQLQAAVKFTVTAAGVVAPVPPVGPIAVAMIPSVFTKIS